MKNPALRCLALVLLAVICLAPSPAGAQPVATQSRSSGPQEPEPVGPCGRIRLWTIENASPTEGDTPTAIAYSPDGTYFVVAHRDTQNLHVFDAATQQLAALIPLSGSPNDVAFTHDGTRLVTANFFEHTASIVDFASATETAVIPVAVQPTAVHTSPGAEYAVVVCRGDEELSILDLAAGLESFRLPEHNLWFEFPPLRKDPAQYWIFSADYGFVDATTLLTFGREHAKAVFVDVANGTTSTVNSLFAPEGFALSADGSTAVLTHPRFNALTVLDTATRTTFPVAVDNFLVGPVAVDATGRYAICQAGMSADGSVVVDLATQTTSTFLDTGPAAGIVATTGGQFALTVNGTASLVDFASASIVAQLGNDTSVFTGAASPSQPQAVLLADQDEEVLVFDTSGPNGRLTRRLRSGSGLEADGPRRVAITPDGRWALTSNLLSDTVSIVDVETRQLARMFAVGDRPAGIAVTPDGKRAVVAHLGSELVAVIDLETFAMRAVPIPDATCEVQISPDSRLAYVSSLRNDAVWRIVLETGEVWGEPIQTGDMEYGSGPRDFQFDRVGDITLSPEGSTLVTCDLASDQITIIDTASWTISDVVKMPFPRRAIFGSSGGKILIAAQSDVLIVSRLKGHWQVTKTLLTGGAGHLAITPNGQQVYVGTNRSIELWELPAARQRGTIPIAHRTTDLKMNPEGTCLWVVSGFETFRPTHQGGPYQRIREGQLTLIDVASSLGEVVDQIDLPSYFAEMALDAAGRRGVIVDPLDDRVHVFEPRR